MDQRSVDKINFLMDKARRVDKEVEELRIRLRRVRSEDEESARKMLRLRNIESEIDKLKNISGTLYTQVTRAISQASFW